MYPAEFENPGLRRPWLDLCANPPAYNYWLLYSVYRGPTVGLCVELTQSPTDSWMNVYRNIKPHNLGTYSPTTGNYI